MPRLSQLFAPKEREFFDLFEEAGSNIVRAAELLERMLDQWPDHGELARDVVVCEQEGDRITHDIIQRLNSTFVTPIDREDIYALASAMDDVVDFIEEVADFLALYRIEAPMEQSQQLARILHQASRQKPFLIRSRSPGGMGVLPPKASHGYCCILQRTLKSFRTVRPARKTPRSMRLCRASTSPSRRESSSIPKKQDWK